MKLQTLLMLYLIVVFGSLTFNLSSQDRIDISGEWGFQLDPMDFRMQVGGLDFRYATDLQDSIILPAITDNFKQGIKSSYRFTDRLTREFEYMGPAWYQKHIFIPNSWEGKRILLNLERVHWLSTVYIDANKASSCDYVSTPHLHDLTDFLQVGEYNNLYICVDNRYQYPTHKWNHAHTEFTQINWNGILGDMVLEAVDPVYIDDLQVYPNVEDKSIRLKVGINNLIDKQLSGFLKIDIKGENYSFTKTLSVDEAIDQNSVIYRELDLGQKIKLWDEFNPNVYELTCFLELEDNKDRYFHSRSTSFGMREVTHEKNKILINGKPVHLRGTVENGVFPKTGHAPVDEESWEHVLKVLKEYGMNHIRFHSWCPPKAAFTAADKLGVYLQVELPFWGSDAESDLGKRYDFFRREQKAILKEYGNHPSFVLYCNGNEITGDFEFIEEITRSAKQNDPRRLYSGATARSRIPSDQYFVTHKTNKGLVTVYEGRPSTNWDRSRESDIDVPVIAHEAGQRCMYPNFKEMPKYTGPVKPRNFEVFKELLESKGMLDLADDFFQASGALTVIEYKDVIEALLRTSSSAGFQLLSLNDFPGQGYAFVGILDPFWDSKGLISSDEFRQFCSQTVPLLRFDKRSFFTDEIFEAKAELYNYTDISLSSIKPQWFLEDSQGNIYKSGILDKQKVTNNGIFQLGDISFSFDGIAGSQKIKLTLQINDSIKNSWEFWVFEKPEVSIAQSTDNVLYTKTFDSKALNFLKEGKRVVLHPHPSNIKGRKSTFHNHFWNPIMFKWPPMTLGCLIHDDHPVFKHFPTENHTNWQWWDILENSKVMELGEAPDDLIPFIQPIDSHDNNEKLGIGFEAQVLNGSLLVLALDIETNIDKRPATQQLLQSINYYVHNTAFAPHVRLSPEYINSLLQ